MSEYRVNLEIFAGPLDLLLYLIQKEEVDIYDISITKITDQYIKYIEILKDLDIDVAGDFLVMAATLMQIKSAMLLPKADVEQLEGGDISDPRTELIRQLLEYKKIKDAANLLNAAAGQQEKRFNRPTYILDALKTENEPLVDMEQISIWDLLEVFSSVMVATGAAADIRHITDETPIDLYQIEILHRLQTEGPLEFRKIFEGAANRFVMIGYFLAILELVREKLVLIEQIAGPGSFYMLKALTEEPAEKAVKEAMMTFADDSANNQPPDAQPQQHNAVPIEELPPKNQPDELLDEPQQDDQQGEIDQEQIII